MTDQPSPAPGAAAPAEPRETPRPPWWRRRGVATTAGVLVLLPATLGTPWWLDHQDNLDWGVTAPNATPVDGDTADLAGSTWTYLGMMTEEAYPGSQTVDAAFTVRPSDQLAANRLYSHCAARAVDGERTWPEGPRPEENPDLPDSRAVADFSGGCTHPDYDEGHLPVGEESPLLVHFIVPDDRVAGLRIEVEVATNDPEVDYDQSDEEWEEDVMETIDNPEREKDNPPEPAALSFSADKRLDLAELDRYTFDVGY